MNNDWDEDRIDIIGQNGNDALHYTRDIMKYEDEYTAWLYVNKPIFNGESLIHYLEDGVTYDIFLKEMGYTDE